MPLRGAVCRAGARAQDPAIPPSLALMEDAPVGATRGAAAHAPTLVAMSWFPAQEWPEAIRRWPDLLESLPADHQASSHAMEVHPERVARELVGRGLHVAALMVDGLVVDAEAADPDPGTGGARSTYAARLLSEGRAVVVWPPGRSEPCWCGRSARTGRAAPVSAASHAAP